jgi:type II secretion system protein D
MKPLKTNSTPGQISRVVLCLLYGLLFALPAGSSAQVRIINGQPVMPPSMPTPPPSSSSSSSGGDSSKGGGPWVPSDPLNATASSGTNADDVQLSFQGANIDMVVQWLAQTTGKTVVKHPQVQCQLNVVSSKKVSQREAINTVYRALALEGFTVVETSRTIMIVPEGKEPRMTPEVVDGNAKELPEGRQRLMKVFSLSHVQAANIREKIQPALSDKATVTIDEHANQIVISDFNDNLRVAGELIAALDTDHPDDIAVRVLPLKHMGATDLAKELAPLYQKMNGKTPGSSIDVAADDRSNSLIILSSESDYNALERIIGALDTADAQEKIRKTFVLKNADAQDVAKQLQDLGQEQDNNNRYPYYYYSFDSGSSSKAGKKMNVVADRRRNAIIVQAPPSEMESVEKIIAELDQSVEDDSLAPKIFHLKYVSAVDMEDVLNELFLKKQQSRSYLDYIFDTPQDNSGGTDAGRLYGKVRITSEPYSNTILVTSNSKENLAVVEDVLNQLDSPSEAGESTMHIPLMFAKAPVVAKNINILFAKNGAPPFRQTAQQQQQQQNNNGLGQQQGQQASSDSSESSFALAQDIKEEGYFPWIGGQPDNTRNGDRNSPRPVSDLVGRVRVVADERGNALLISANVHFFPQILKLINQLDAPSDQVLIEARIVEVSSDYLDKLGVRYSPDGTKVFTADDYDNSLLAHVSGKDTKGFGGSTIVNNAAGGAATGIAPANMLAQMRSGVVESTINIDFLVQFLKKTTEATVLGEPQININDNETGRLFVGQQVPILTAQNNAALGGISQNFIYKDVGVILEVKPHINSSGDVELSVHAESSTVVPGETILGGAVFNTRNFQTDLTAKNGQTLVLGGILQQQLSDTLRKTPVLGSIPGLGWLFKKKDKQTDQVELMVFLRPRVVHSEREAEKLLEDINQRFPKVKQWEQGNEIKPDAKLKK